MTLTLPRRKFLIGMAALVAAPAIVRAESLMKIKPVRPEPQYLLAGDTITFGPSFVRKGSLWVVSYDGGKMWEVPDDQFHTKDFLVGRIVRAS